MTEYLLPPLAALLLWWLGTGAVIVLDRAPRVGQLWTLAAASAFALAALLCIGHTAHVRSTTAAYGGFSCALVVWGWHELAFLRGWVSGPRRTAASLDAPRWQRLREAVQVLLWHELGLIATMLALWLWIGNAANPVAAWTFSLLWVMRVSAKLNLFLGVRNLALEFLPPRMAYLASYFRRRRMNPLMPLSVGLGTGAVVALISAATTAAAGPRVALMLMASLLALALVEHLMMVLPMQPDALWRWALKAGR